MPRIQAVKRRAERKRREAGAEVQRDGIVAGNYATTLRHDSAVNLPAVTHLVEERNVSRQIDRVEHAIVRDADTAFAAPLKPVMRISLQLPAQLLDLGLDLRLDFRRQREECLVERRAVNLRCLSHGQSERDHSPLAVVELLLGAVRARDESRLQLFKIFHVVSQPSLNFNHLLPRE